MPLSVWPGARFVPGGHASFFGLLNTFVHIVMYFYYMMSAMGPQYQKYLWWKQHLTTLQMIQFVGIMTHGFSPVYCDNCDFIQVVNDVAARDADWVDWFVGVDKVKNRTGDWFFGVAALRNDVRTTTYRPVDSSLNVYQLRIF